MFLALAGLSCHLTQRGTEGPGGDRKPNIIVIFIDDLGYGDLEPFGSAQNKMPRLDRMAAEGIKFTSFYSAAPVCSPSRAALMTGCYPKRVGLAAGSNSRTVLWPKDTMGLNPDEKTLAEILREAGYATGCFGKWHLGDQPAFLPGQQGFDTYFGIPYSNDMWLHHPRAEEWNFSRLPLLRDHQVVGEVETMADQSDLCRRFTEAAIDFIREHQDRPFFVYLPHAFVHVPRNARPAFLRRAGVTEPLDEEQMAVDIHYFEQARARAQIEEVDWSAGRILDTVRELGLAEHTVVIFTSDNGGDKGCSNAPLRGHKGTTWEGGMRVPAIAWWPGRIAAGGVCDELATTMDLLPTLAALAGGSVPEGRVIDGQDIRGLLFGQPGAASPHESFFYYSGNELKAVRSGAWKLHTNGALYDLEEDIGESRDVAASHPDVAARLRGYLDQADRDLGCEANCRPAGEVSEPEFLLPIAR